MTLKTRQRGNATEYGIVLGLVVGLSLYGLKTLGPVLNGNFKKLDSIGTLSLLVPLWDSGTGTRSPGSPGDQQDGDQGGSIDSASGQDDANISHPQGVSNVVVDYPKDPGYDNLVAGSLGQQGIMGPTKPPVTVPNPSTYRPPFSPPSSDPINPQQPVTADPDDFINDFGVNQIGIVLWEPIKDLKQHDALVPQDSGGDAAVTF